MRKGWERGTELVKLTAEALTALVQLAFPGERVVQSELAEGGLANTNVRLTLSRRRTPVLLRLYTRSPAQGRMEYALNERVSSYVPTAGFYHFADSNPITGHPYALLEWIDGLRLELVAPRARSGEVAELGRSVGAALARVHSLTFPATGFFDLNLEVVTPISVGQEGLSAYVRRCLLDGCGGTRLGAGLTEALMRFAETEGKLLDTWDGPPCLTHGDYGGSNILVRREVSGWNTAAVIDWEFAFSGSPFFDFGNLLRPPLGSLPGFEGAVVEGYTEAGGRLPDAWRRMSHLADLTAWVDFLSREEAGPKLVEDARARVQRTLADWSGMG